jgi:hypothetical protein
VAAIAIVVAVSEGAVFMSIFLARKPQARGLATCRRSLAKRAGAVQFG